MRPTCPACNAEDAVILMTDSARAKCIDCGILMPQSMLKKEVKPYGLKQIKEEPMNELVSNEIKDVAILHDGSTTISQHKLADLCGVSQVAIHKHLRLSPNYHVNQGVTEEIAFQVISYYAYESRAANDTARRTLAKIGAAGMRVFNYRLAGIQVGVQKAPVQHQLPDFNNPSEAARAWADERERADKAESHVGELEDKVADAQPAIKFVEDVGNTDKLYYIGEVGKGLRYTRDEFFAMLRADGILFKDGKYNLPRREYENEGYLTVKLRHYYKDGKRAPYYVTFVTGKGIVWLTEKYGRKV